MPLVPRPDTSAAPSRVASEPGVRRIGRSPSPRASGCATTPRSLSARGTDLVLPRQSSSPCISSAPMAHVASARACSLDAQKARKPSRTPDSAAAGRITGCSSTRVAACRIPRSKHVRVSDDVGECDASPSVASITAAWGLGGVTVFPAPDAAGAIGCGCSGGRARRHTRRAVYAGGVASGNVLFDVLALALLGRRQSSSGRSVDDSTVAPARISSRAASTLPHTSQSRNPRALPSPSA